MNSQIRQQLSRVPFRPVSWMARDIEMNRDAGGVIYLKSRVALDRYARHLPEFLSKWATERPDQIWLAQRDASDQWQTLTYAAGKRIVDSVTEALFALPNVARGPLVILSGNSIEHAVVAMAAMQAGIPVAPISTAYSLQSSDHGKLKYIFGLLKPGAVFAQDADQYAKALSAVDLADIDLIVVKGRATGSAHRYEDLVKAVPTAKVAKAIEQIDPDATAKLLFTSGSTGMPKAVELTHRMMCANAAMLMQAREIDLPPDQASYLDWLPWNHVMGGNAVFNLVLARGASLYIDDGKPVPGQFEKTLRNLREISPITYSNAPAGYIALATALEHDEPLRKNFFKNLYTLAYGGARLPDDIFDRFQKLAVETIGQRIVFVSTYGATEVAPAATTTHWFTERVGLIGLPCAGTEIKLLPLGGGKFEIRIRSVSVTPGYFNQPELTAAAFDEEGFYKIGDMVEFLDPDDVNEGLLFAGRVVEDFKLLSSTFVQVGALRVDAIACASPFIQDAIVTGQDRDYVGLLAWLNIEACRAFVGDNSASTSALISSPAISEALKASFKAHNAAAGNAGSRTIRRVVLLLEPPSIDGNEITDKGYINQRVGLGRRARDVQRLYADPPDSTVITIPL
ncbi:AMP-binding protein [Afipia massiliensis]|uniref:AMP-binding protein n=1 Tax=Afipia massiliensis TaxID=211460 RepID=UPI003D9B6723